ncbi:MAG TPA: pyridoxal phosphate-dependent aminotransferase [Bacteroidota bacterium]|nr:pyridoxal phosphate-dependent aminotransferase [Bacteroidota bacterium]
MLSLSKKIQEMEESQTLALTAQAAKLKKSGVDICSLTAGEPDFPTPMRIKQAGIKAIESDFSHYTANNGTEELRGAIAQKFKRDNDLEFAPSQILVSCGAKHSVYNALQAICNEGDQVIVFAPYWVSYTEITKLVGAVPVVLPSTQESQFKVTAKQLRSGITTKTKALIFNSPCNPTGTVYTREEIEAIAEVVRESGIYVISDEIYEKIMYDGLTHFSIGSIPAIKDQVITINGISKSYAMTGWRIGYMGAMQPIIDAAGKVQSQVTSNPTSISQKAAFEALSKVTDEVQTMAAEFKQRRDYMVSEFQKIPGLCIVEPKGAFYLFPSVENFVGKKFGSTVITDDTAMAKYLLDEERLAVVPGDAFGMKNHLRISYACPQKELERGVERLKRGLGKLI